ncbi:CHAP domain-containing protein [Nonomuraea sp. B10E15]|uniref:CHAP domain-containing protein n=1 Tax=Nonomuraea sp. B10E15 TaxID=3153560 RepID=UPI00325C3D78
MRQELGYREKSGQVTKFGQWYADRVQDTQYRNAPWCDMFLAWAADKAGLTEYVGEFAWTPSHAAWFIKQDAWTRKPEPGALVFFDWRGGESYKGVDHVGVVERVAGKKIHTIEANVDREWLKRKTRETDKVVGYGVPRLVKANAERLDEIRSTERPFVSAPRPETGNGSPLDVLGTPPALLAAMVITTIVLTLRVTGRRRGTHRRFTRRFARRFARRFPWPRNAPTTRRPAKTSSGTRPPKVREKARAATHPGPAQRHPAPEQPARPARIRVPAGPAHQAAKQAAPTRRRPYEPR